MHVKKKIAVAVSQWFLQNYFWTLLIKSQVKEQRVWTETQLGSEYKGTKFQDPGMS